MNGMGQGLARRMKEDGMVVQDIVSILPCKKDLKAIIEHGM